jgi:hypothetical protein
MRTAIERARTAVAAGRATLPPSMSEIEAALGDVRVEERPPRSRGHSEISALSRGLSEISAATNYPSRSVSFSNLGEDEAGNGDEQPNKSAIGSRRSSMFSGNTERSGSSTFASSGRSSVASGSSSISTVGSLRSSVLRRNIGAGDAAAGGGVTSRGGSPGSMESNVPPSPIAASGRSSTSSEIAGAAAGGGGPVAPNTAPHTRSAGAAGGSGAVSIFFPPKPPSAAAGSGGSPPSIPHVVQRREDGLVPPDLIYDYFSSFPKPFRLPKISEFKKQLVAANPALFNDITNFITTLRIIDPLDTAYLGKKAYEIADHLHSIGDDYRNILSTKNIIITPVPAKDKLDDSTKQSLIQYLMLFMAIAKMKPADISMFGVTSFTRLGKIEHLLSTLLLNHFTPAAAPPPPPKRGLFGLGWGGLGGARRTRHRRSHLLAAHRLATSTGTRPSTSTRRRSRRLRTSL